MRTPRRSAVACSARAADGRRDGRGELVIDDAVEIADAQRAEDEDRGAHAGLPQRDPLLDVRAREHRGAFGLERQADRRGAVAVGVGLDDGDDRRPGRTWVRQSGGRSKKAGDGAVVRPDGVEVDVRDGLSNHVVASAFRRKSAPIARLPAEAGSHALAAVGSHAPLLRYCAPWARFSNRVYWLRNDSFTVPIGPLRCLPMMISAMPCSSGFASSLS